MSRNGSDAISLAAYCADPCGLLSIPYWKNKHVRVPGNMKIVHDRDYSPDSGFEDEPYFRLLHDLKCIGRQEGAFRCQTAEEADLPLMAEIINRCYEDLSVSVEQLQHYRQTEAFAPELWIIAYAEGSQEPAGCGIADFDAEAGEGVLEWIQVLPQHRRRGAGRRIVNELLRRMAPWANFATVSGRINNPARPEMLYRNCGFTGSDIWHILTKK